MTQSTPGFVRLSGPADTIYERIKDVPIVSPHGHTDPSWFADNQAFSDPAELLIIPDHYVFRMLYSQGVALEKLGVGVAPEERDPRAIFKLFAAHWNRFLGTPSRQWLEHTFVNVFDIAEPFGPDTADLFYDIIAEKLQTPEFRPRALFERFNLEVLATTDGALDDLAHHKKGLSDGWGGRLVPTFRPDTVLNPALPEFGADVAALGTLTNEDTKTYAGYLSALRSRRAYFKDVGATATDHDVPNIHTNWLSEGVVSELFARAISGQLNADEQVKFYGHMLIEMAQMSIEDGLVMQIHGGNSRSTNQYLLDRFGRDKGADIPHAADWVGGLDALLNKVGNNPDFTLILFTLDETTYARELAPMAGHWPALKLGPPWWFHDSLAGIARYFDQVVETAGYWNLAGFNDDTRALLSIPARHDLWRKGVSIHLARQIERGLFGPSDAHEIAKLLTRDLALEAYKLGEH